jgi:hypothetical protein
VAHRWQLQKMKTAEENRLGTAPSEAVRSDIEEHLAFLEERLEETERGDLDCQNRRSSRKQPALARGRGTSLFNSRRGRGNRPRSHGGASGTW